MASSFLRFLDHTQRRTTVGRIPLVEWSARRRDLYLTTHNTHNRQTSMPPVRFKPTISAGERPQTYALDRAATGTGAQLYIHQNKWQNSTMPEEFQYDIYLMLCVQTWTPDDGRKDRPKHIEWYSINSKIVHIVGFTVELYHYVRSHERQNYKFRMCDSSDMKNIWKLGAMERREVAR